jgi:2-polyprenyl-3-methyl-5-hydroxy-6-metoxy-1,4-benzoquinol methylase
MNVCPLCGSDATKRFDLAHTSVWACGSDECGLQFANPQLDGEMLARTYAKYYYPSNDSLGGAIYENTPEVILRQTFSELSSRIGPLMGKTLLDFGCGVGKLCLIAQEYGLQVTGIEADPSARLAAAQAGGLRVYADFQELQAALPFERFDIITMWDVIEHLREPWKDLQNLSKRLRPGGYVLVSTPNARSLRARLRQSRWDNILNPTHFYYFIRRSLRSVLHRAGFDEVTEVHFAVRYPSHSAIRRLLHHYLVRCRLQGELLFVARSQTAVESRMDKTLP